MGRLEVLEAGILSTIQDLGRPGFLRYGIPHSGALDKRSAIFANWLVGNPPGAAVLELTLHRQQFLFHDTCLVAVTGAEFGPEINGQAIPMYETIRVRAGDILAFPSPGPGMRSYLSIHGGIGADEFFCSKSTYLPARLGGFGGRPLKRTDVLHYPAQAPAIQRSIPEHWRPRLDSVRPIRMLRGPEWNACYAHAQELLLNSQFLISTLSDRMGLRLEGPALKPMVYSEIISSPVLPGTMQIPDDGLPIILLSDGQTAGGYPRVAQLVHVDLDYVSQRKPHDQISFILADPDLAHRLYKHRYGIYHTLYQIA